MPCIVDDAVRAPNARVTELRNPSSDCAGCSRTRVPSLLHVTAPTGAPVAIVHASKSSDNVVLTLNWGGGCDCGWNGLLRRVLLRRVWRAQILTDLRFASVSKRLGGFSIVALANQCESHCIRTIVIMCRLPRNFH